MLLIMLILRAVDPFCPARFRQCLAAPAQAGLAAIGRCSIANAPNNAGMFLLELVLLKLVAVLQRMHQTMLSCSCSSWTGYSLSLLFSECVKQ